MSSLVRTPFFQIEMTEQRIPDSFGYVIVRQRRSLPGAENEPIGASSLELFLQRIHHPSGHVDRPKGAVILRVTQFTSHQRLAHQDLTALEIHEFPLKPIDLPGAHAGKEPHNVVVPKIRSDSVDDLLHLADAEWFNIGAGDLQ